MCFLSALWQLQLCSSWKKVHFPSEMSLTGERFMGCSAVGYWYTLHEACCQVCSTFKGVKTVSTEGASCKCIVSPQSIY